MAVRTWLTDFITFGWNPGDNNWGPSTNGTIRNLGAFALGVAESRTGTWSPVPSGANIGEVRIVPDGANANNIAIWDGDTGAQDWVYVTPKTGATFYIKDVQATYRYDGAQWVIDSAGGSSADSKVYLNALTVGATANQVVAAQIMGVRRSITDSAPNVIASVAMPPAAADTYIIRGHYGSGSTDLFSLQVNSDRTYAVTPLSTTQVASDVHSFELVSSGTPDTAIRGLSVAINAPLTTDSVTLGQASAKIIDGITFAATASAYSLRLLSSTYSGPLVQLRRSSDSAVMDFSAGSGGDIDISAVDAWKGASTDVFVVRMYDQTGNNNHSIATVAAEQPVFFTAGAYETVATGEYAWSYLPQTSFGAESRKVIHPLSATTFTSAGFFYVLDIQGDTQSVLGATNAPSGTLPYGPTASTNNPTAASFQNSGANAQGYVDDVLVNGGTASTRQDWWNALGTPSPGKHRVRAENVDMALYSTTGWRSAQYNSGNGSFKSSAKVALSIFYPEPPSAGDISTMSSRIAASFNA